MPCHRHDCPVGHDPPSGWLWVWIERARRAYRNTPPYQDAHSHAPRDGDRAPGVHAYFYAAGKYA